MSLLEFSDNLMQDTLKQSQQGGSDVICSYHVYVSCFFPPWYWQALRSGCHFDI